MSTHTIRGDKKKHEIIFGWDPMQVTFFLHVVDTSVDEDAEGYDVLWIGTSFYEIFDLKEIDEKVRPYRAGGIPDEKWGLLRREQEESDFFSS